MQCPALEELEKYLDGELAPDRQSWIQDHTSGCASCGETLRDISENIGFLVQFAEPLARARRPAPQALLGEPPAVDGFEIGEEVHRGGQGVVFRALQCSTQREVAIKFPMQGAFTTERQRRRFEREVDLAARLVHPNIVTLFEGGVARSGIPYFAMEWIDGKPLHRCPRSRADPIPARLALFRKVCRGVLFAHQRGVIHRDLKPGNILVDRDGEPKVLDFGLARPVDEPAASVAPQTRSGEFLGTLVYASPEQLQRRPETVDIRTDIYSLGVILYEMLTGEPPYPTDLPMASLVRRIAEEPPPRPSSRAPSIDRDLDSILLKTLEKEPDHRYSSVALLEQDLARYLRHEPVEARAGGRWYLLRKALRRHRLAAGALALILLTLVTATAVSFRFWRRSEGQRQAAENATRETLAATRRTELTNDYWRQVVGVVYPEVGPDARILDLLMRAAEDFEARFADQPLVRMDLHQTFAQSFLSMVRPGEAGVHARKARELAIQELGENSVEAWQATVALATALLDQFRYPELAEELDRCRSYFADAPQQLRKESLIVQRLDIQLKIQQGLHTEATRLLESLRPRWHEVSAAEPRRFLDMEFLEASLLESEGRMEDAADLWKAVLERDESALPWIHARHARLLLAWVHLRGGQVREAERDLLDLLELLEERPEDRAFLSKAQLGLGQVLLRDERPAEAEALLEPVVAWLTENYGKEHGSTLNGLTCLAWCKLELGQFGEALPLLQEQVTVNARVRGETHLQTLFARDKVASCLASLNRWDEALETGRALVADASRSLGERAAPTLAFMNNHALVLRYKGDLPAAESAFRRVVELQVQEHGLEHGESGTYLGNLARVLEAQGVYQEAAEAAGQSVVGKQAAFGEDHPTTVLARLVWAQCLERSQQLDQARTILLDVLASTRRTHPDSPELADRLIETGRFLTNKGDLDEAEALLQESLDMASGFETEDLALLLRGQRTLAGCLARLDQRGEAEELLLECLDWTAESTEPAALQERQEVLTLLVRLLREWGHADEAREYADQLRRESDPASPLKFLDR